MRLVAPADRRAVPVALVPQAAVRVGQGRVDLAAPLAVVPVVVAFEAVVAVVLVAVAIGLGLAVLVLVRAPAVPPVPPVSLIDAIPLAAKVVGRPAEMARPDLRVSCHATTTKRARPKSPPRRT